MLGHFGRVFSATEFPKVSPPGGLNTGGEIGRLNWEGKLPLLLVIGRWWLVVAGWVVGCCNWCCGCLLLLWLWLWLWLVVALL